MTAVDAEKIQRVLMNLFSNAFKFVPDDGKVRARIQLSKNNMFVSMEDSGLGVKPELRKIIFERFRQRRTNRQFGGTGLGVAIAKEFLELHQGSLQVLDSEFGGACFQMVLPVVHLSQASIPTALPSIQRPRKISSAKML